jgi:glycosyltransferase involved in cell wall biosynthesis
VLPSRIDAAPRAAIEATVVGTPVIATRVGGVPEILDGGRGGTMVDPDDPASLAAAIEDAANDRAGMRARADHALHRNRELFSVARSAERHVEIYERAGKKRA